MSFYVIADPSDPFVSSPVFQAGGSDADEAVAAFTNPERARAYVESAGWKGQETVVELKELDVLRWLLAASDAGAGTLAVDPQFDEQQDVPQPTLSIPELLGELVRTVAERVQAPAPPRPAQMISMDLLHCQHCGKLVEQEAGSPAPECCGEPMALAAGDAVERFASSK